MVAGDGRVLLYDLTRSTEHPVKILDVCGASAPVYDLAFNVRAPELFATTDQQCVKVSHESHGPCNQLSISRMRLYV